MNIIRTVTRKDNENGSRRKTQNEAICYFSLAGLRVTSRDKEASPIDWQLPGSRRAPYPPPPPFSLPHLPFLPFPSPSSPSPSSKSSVVCECLCFVVLIESIRWSMLFRGLDVIKVKCEVICSLLVTQARNVISYTMWDTRFIARMIVLLT